MLPVTSSAPDPPGFPISLFRRIEELLKAVKCLVFDAYGTLFDVHSVTIAADRIFPGQGSELSKAWRAGQLEYIWLRSLMNRYEDFWKVTESALVAACSAMKLPLDAATRGELMEV